MKQESSQQLGRGLVGREGECARLDGLLSTAELIRSANSLIELLAAESAETEAQGRMTDRSAQALRDAGFLSLFAPAELGGREADIITASEVFRLLARGCGSSAWTAMLPSGGSYLAALLGPRVRKEIWGNDPRAVVCGGFGMAQDAVRVQNGLQVSGRWQPLTGSDHAQWALLGVPIIDADGNVVDRGMALVPMTAATVERTWHMAGMQGTGSNTVVVEATVVPDHRILSLTRLLAGEYSTAHGPGSIYSAAPIPFTSVTMLAPLAGMAETALETTLARLKAGKPLNGTIYARAEDSPTVQLSVSDAASHIESAKLHTARAVGDVALSISEGAALPPAQRARIRMDLGTAAKNIRSAITLLLDAGGSSSFALDAPVQQIWRNIEVASRHQLISHGLSREVYARSLFHTPTQATALL
ncbi:acyl-CoA dehydrogenase family protein [Streptomyces sp. NPDC055692]|uniref:acyl-CoA dehydrogenase family protein n=1 Tax=Streptomyces sp. NPDC055692 TaxID=3155683 RepID=UPI003439F224